MACSEPSAIGRRLRGPSDAHGSPCRRARSPASIASMTAAPGARCTPSRPSSQRRRAPARPAPARGPALGVGPGQAHHLEQAAPPRGRPAARGDRARARAHALRQPRRRRGPTRGPRRRPAVALEPDHGAPRRRQRRAPVDRLERPRERHPGVVDLDPRLEREALAGERQVRRCRPRACGRRGSVPPGRRPGPAAGRPRRRAAPRRRARRGPPRCRRPPPPAPRSAPLGHLRACAPGTAGAPRAPVGARRRRHHVHQLADAVRRGRGSPSGAAWSSSSRRARSPGMRSSGSAVDLLQVRPHHPVDEGARRSASPARRPPTPSRAAGALGRVGTLVEVAAAHHRARRGRTTPGGPPSAGRRRAAARASSRRPRRGRTGCGRPGRRRSRRARRVTQSPPGTPSPSTSITSAPAAGERERGPQPGGAAPSTTASAVGIATPQPTGPLPSNAAGRPSPPPAPAGWAMLAAR